MIKNITFQNYRPVSLLLVCGNFLEKLIFNGILKFFSENGLILSNQSGCNPGGSNVNQLSSIVHDIYKYLDYGFDVRGVFLDNLKAFNKIQHYDVWLKLKQNSKCQADIFQLLAELKLIKKFKLIMSLYFPHFYPCSIMGLRKWR